MSKSNKSLIISICAVVLILIAAVAFIVLRQKSPVPSQPDVQQNEEMKIETSTTEKEYKADNGDVLLKTSISIPVITGSSQTAERINSYYQDIFAQINEFAAGELLDIAKDDFENADIPFFGPYELSENFETDTMTDNFLSVVRNRYEFAGGVHGATVVFTDNFNLNNGGKISVADFFKEGTDYRAIINNEIEKQIKLSSTDMGLYEDYDLNTWQPEDFIATNDGLTIIFQQYSIAPYAAGILSFDISFDSISEYLDTDFLAEIGLNQAE